MGLKLEFRCIRCGCLLGTYEGESFVLVDGIHIITLSAKCVKCYERDVDAFLGLVRCLP